MCRDTGIYYPFLGSNPAVGFSNPGNTSICAGDELKFVISGTSLNPPITEYTISFHDGTPEATYSHPPPDYVLHTFNKNSCGRAFPAVNSFGATIVAKNPCLPVSSITVIPVLVSDKPKADFAFLEKDTVCVKKEIILTDITQSKNVDDGSCSGKSVWKISGVCGTDWTIRDGCSSLGRVFDSDDPSDWIGGSNPLKINFINPGSYNITLKASGFKKCGIDSITKTICINPLPEASFTPSKETGCAPFSITTSTTTNKLTCGEYKYKWEVSYTNPANCLPAGSSYKYLNGTTSESKEPEFEFINPGNYKLMLRVVSPGAGCAEVVTERTVMVKGKPNVSFISASIPASICQGGCISPAALFNCYATDGATYLWSFPGGVPESSDAANPGQVCYPNPGVFTITLTVKNDCNDTTITRNITVNAIPEKPTVTSNSPLCAGGTLILSVSPVIPGAVYIWTGPGGPFSNGPTLTRSNATVTMSGRYCVTVEVLDCKSVESCVDVIVHPKLPPPVPCPLQTLEYCQGGQSVALCAGPALQGHVLKWYAVSNPAEILPDPPVPPTSTAGSFCYGVYQENETNGCKSGPVEICVSVLPSITNNVIGSDTVFCGCGNPGVLCQAGGAIAGGNGAYLFQWQRSVDNGVNYSPVGVTACYSPGAICSTTKFRRIVTSGSCSSESNVVTITVTSKPENSIIPPSNGICAGTVPPPLDGSSHPGASYKWEKLNATGPTLADGINNEEDYQPPLLTETTTFRRTVMIGNCSSDPVDVTVIVYKNPVAPTLQPAVRSICEGSDVTINAENFIGTIHQWESRTLGMDWKPRGAGNPLSLSAVSENTEVQLIVKSEGFGLGCNVYHTSNIVSIKVAKKPVGGNTNDDDTVCSGTNAGSIQLINHSGSIIRWEKTTNLAAGWNEIGNTGTSQTYNNLTETTWYRAVIKNDPCPEVYSDTTIITVVKSVTPADAGKDQKWCRPDSIQLIGNPPSIGVGTWSQVSGPNDAVITDSSKPVTWIKNLVAGTYVFQWKIAVSGQTVCIPSTDLVEIKIWDSTTTPKAGSDTTICDLVTCRTIQLRANAGRDYETTQWILLPGSPSGSYFSNPLSPTSAFTVCKPGIYRLIWRISNDSANGCPPKEDRLEIKVFEKPEAGAISPPAPQICAGDSIKLFYTPIRGEVEKWQYNPRPNDTTNWRDRTETSPFITFLKADSSFAVRLIVISPGAAPDCFFKDTSRPVLVTVRPRPPAKIEVNPDSLVLEEPDYTFFFRDSFPASPSHRYLWQMGDQPGQTRGGREISYTYGYTGQFPVALTVTNIVTGCEGRDSVTVKIRPVPGYLQIPNAMCIGCADPALRRLLPLGIGLKEYRLRIYSKWGQLVFETTKLNADGSPAEAWNGDFRNRPQNILEQNAYWWVAEAKFINGTEWKGMVYPPNPRPVKSAFITFVK